MVKNLGLKSSKEISLCYLKSKCNQISLLKTKKYIFDQFLLEIYDKYILK